MQNKSPELSKNEENLNEGKKIEKKGSSRMGAPPTTTPTLLFLYGEA